MVTRSFEADIELPIGFEIEAEDEGQAEVIADERFAQCYELIEEAVGGWRAAGVWPENTWLRARYDDTSVTEVIPWSRVDHDSDDVRIAHDDALNAL